MYNYYLLSKHSAVFPNIEKKQLFFLPRKNFDQINPQHYLPIEEGAAGNADPHADVHRLQYRMVHHQNGDEITDDHKNDVDQHLAFLYLVLQVGISGEVVNDPTLNDRYCYAYYTALKIEKLKFIIFSTGKTSTTLVQLIANWFTYFQCK